MKTRTAVMLPACAALGFATTALAETSDGSDTSPSAAGAERGKLIEEVFVTAQKREERLQDVPISISVLDGDTLDRSTVGVAEALNRVPGVMALASSSFGNNQLTVRGVTAANATLTGTSPIGYYLDSMPFGLVRSAVSPDANAYDLERVEVLRGPQGTLYGASSANGVVRVITNDADLEKFEVKGRGAGSSTKDGGTNYRADMALNAPIVEGKLAARVVAGYENMSGWIDRPNEKDANDSEVSNFRARVHAQPTENLSIGLMGWRSRSELGALPNGLKNRTNISLVDEPISTDYDTYGLKIGYDFSAFTLTSSTSYLEYENRSKTDYVALFGPAFVGNLLDTRFNSTIFAQEVYLNSTGEGVWKWTAGAMYRDGKDKFFQWRQAYANPNGNRSYDTSESYAVFGELTRLLFDNRFEITGGLRYFEDKQVMQEVSRLNQVVVTNYFRREATFDAVSPRVTLTWHPSKDFTTYASYAEGFRSGFSQLSVVLSQVPGFPAVEPDNLTNYELGAKGTAFDGLIGFNTAVYYTDWEDVQQFLQVQVNSGLGTALNVAAPVNGKSASGVGFEAGLTINPLDDLAVTLNYGWNDLTIDSDIYSPTGSIIFLKGDRLAFSPEETVGASIDYSLPLSGGYQWRFSLSGNYISSLRARALISGVSTVIEGDSMLTSRASIGLEASDHWSIELFGDNLNDEKGTPYPSPTVTQNVRLRPRTIGAQLEVRF